jgi:MFS family permease
LKRDSAFVVLRSPQFRTLWFDGLIVLLSVIGSNFARAWVARRLTGTNAGIGGVLFAFGVPAALLAPLAGVVADRFSKRVLLVLAQLVMMGTSLFVGLALTFGALEYWMLLVGAALHGAAMVVHGPCMVASVAEIIDRHKIASAISLLQINGEVMRVAGPALAGTLLAIGTMGEELVFLGSAALFGFGALISLGLPIPPSRPAPTRSPLGDLRAGVAYVRHRRHLGLLVFMTLAVVMIGFPYTAFLASMADRFDVGPAGFGVMSAITALGSVPAVLIGARRGPARLWSGIVVSGITFGVGLVALGIAPSFVVALVVLPWIGAGSVLFQSSTVSLLLTLSNFEYHGRLQGIVMIGMGGWGMVALPLGFLADQIGLGPTLALMGLTIVVVVAIARLRGATDRAVLEMHDLG